MNIAPLYDISPELIIKGAVVFLNTDYYFFSPFLHCERKTSVIKRYLHF